MKSLVWVILCILCGSSVLALGIVPLESMTLDVGEDVPLRVVYKNDVVERGVFVEVVVPEGLLVNGVRVAKSSSRDVESNEVDTREFVLRGVVPGEYVVVASVVEDVEDQAGLGMALRVTTEMKVRVIGDVQGNSSGVNVTIPSSGGSSGGGDGSGGGGTTVAQKSSGSACNGTYTLQNGKWVCTSNVIAETKRDGEEVGDGSQNDAQIADVGAGGGGSFTQGIVDVGQDPGGESRGAEAFIQNGGVSSQSGRGILILVLFLGMCAIVIQLVAYKKVRERVE